MGNMALFRVPSSADERLASTHIESCLTLGDEGAFDHGYRAAVAPFASQDVTVRSLTY